MIVAAQMPTFRGQIRQLLPPNAHSIWWDFSVTPNPREGKGLMSTRGGKKDKQVSPVTLVLELHMWLQAGPQVKKLERSLDN